MPKAIISKALSKFNEDLKNFNQLKAELRQALQKLTPGYPQLFTDPDEWLDKEVEETMDQMLWDSLVSKGKSKSK